MIYYVPICVVLAILGTLLVNPMLYFGPSKLRKLYKTDLECVEDYIKKGGHYRGPLVKKENYSMFSVKFPTTLLVGQIIEFIIVFLLSAFILCFTSNVVVSWTTILAYMWIPGLAQFISVLFYDYAYRHASPFDEVTSFNKKISDDIYVICFFTCFAFILISSVVGIHKGVYNYLHTYDDVTFMEEKYEEYPTVNEETLLQTANLVAGSSLYSPVYRNGFWIYPVANNSSNVASSGYFIVDAEQKDISFVPKDISYSPWASNSNMVERVARRHAPSAVFFGDVSFQIEPETGDIYFAQFYGDYDCFRAGRKVEGVILVNASTGECETHLLNNVPDWVTGVSF